MPNPFDDLPDAPVATANPFDDLPDTSPAINAQVKIPSSSNELAALNFLGEQAVRPMIEQSFAQKFAPMATTPEGQAQFARLAKIISTPDLPAPSLPSDIAAAAGSPFSSMGRTLLAIPADIGRVAGGGRAENLAVADMPTTVPLLPTEIEAAQAPGIVGVLERGAGGAVKLAGTLLGTGLAAPLGIPAGAAAPAVFGASTYADTRSPGAAVESAALGALFPYAGQWGKLVGKKVAEKLMARGLVNEMGARAIGLAGEQAGIQAFGHALNTPEYWQLYQENPTEFFKKFAEQTITLGALGIPGLAGLAEPKQQAAAREAFQQATEEIAANLRESVKKQGANGKREFSPEARVLFGGVSPEVAGTTPEKVAAFAKKAGVPYTQPTATPTPATPPPPAPAAKPVAETRNTPAPATQVVPPAPAAKSDPASVRAALANLPGAEQDLVAPPPAAPSELPSKVESVLPQGNLTGAATTPAAPAQQSTPTPFDDLPDVKKIQLDAPKPNDPSPRISKIQDQIAELEAAAEVGVLSKKDKARLQNLKATLATQAPPPANSVLPEKSRSETPAANKIKLDVPKPDLAATDKPITEADFSKWNSETHVTMHAGTDLTTGEPLYWVVRKVSSLKSANPPAESNLTVKKRIENPDGSYYTKDVPAKRMPDGTLAEIETPPTPALNTYDVFYNGKKIEVQAPTTYAAQQKAVAQLNVPRKKTHMVSVVLTAKGEAKPLTPEVKETQPAAAPVKPQKPARSVKAIEAELKQLKQGLPVAEDMAINDHGHSLQALENKISRKQAELDALNAPAQAPEKPELQEIKKDAATATANQTEPGADDVAARAKALMLERFVGVRRHAGDLASEHIERVADMVHDPVLKAIAYLHDIVEDTNTTLDEIRQKFGDRIADAVDAETWRKDSETYDQYIARLSQNRDAVQSKLADIADNIAVIGKLNTEKAKGKVQLWKGAREKLLATFGTDLTPTLERLTMEDGTPRHNWQLVQIKKVTGLVEPHADGTKPTMIFSGGGPAAGKSTVLKKAIATGEIESEKTVSISADDFKTGEGDVERAGAAGIPEYESIRAAGDPRAAVIVHKESTFMAKAAFARLVHEKKSGVYDATMSHHGDDSFLIIEAKKAGHQTVMMGVTVHPDEAIRRAHQREIQTGRHLPEDVNRAGHVGYSKSWHRYLELVDEGHLDLLLLYDNNRPKEAGGAYLIAKKDKNGLVILDQQAYDSFVRIGQNEREKPSEKPADSRPETGSPEPARQLESGRPDGRDQGGRGLPQGEEQRQTPGNGGLAGGLAKPANAEQPTKSGYNDRGIEGAQPGAASATGDDPQAGGVSDGERGSVQPASGTDAGRPAAGGGTGRGGKSSTDADRLPGKRDEVRPDAGATSSGGSTTGPISGPGNLLPGESGRRNLRLTENPAPTTATQRIKANIDAIRVVKKLEEEKRQPTPEEIKTLSAWSGWGSFKNIFNEGKAERREWDVNWQKKYGKAYDSLKKLLTEDEFNAAAESSVNAHYTSKEVVDWAWQAAARLGYQGGKAIEPSSGSGVFMGYAPENLAVNTRWTAVELDPMTGKIASYLYPEADMRIQGFEEAKLPNGYYDLAITNVPFHEVGPGKEYPDLNLHNYFIARMLDKVKPGGLVVAITSKGTMDANPRQRAILADRGQLVAAIRLPNNAFKESADTEVVTDLLILRKPDGKPFPAENWRNVVDVAPEGSEAPILVNEYYANHPENVLGKHALTGTMYRKNSYTVEGHGPLGPKLAAALDRLPKDILQPPAADESQPTTTQREDYSLYVNKSGHVVQSMNYTETLPTWDSNNKQLVHRAKLYIGARDALKEQYRLERAAGVAAGDIESNRTKLAKAYKALVKELGTEINTKAGLQKLKHLKTDPDYYTLLGLENVKVTQDLEDPSKSMTTITPAAVLSGRVGQVDTPPDKADNAADALAISQAYRGGLDLDYLKQLTGLDEAEIENQLTHADLAFRDPDTGKLETRLEYLAGDIRDKYAKAIFSAKEDPKYLANVEALKAIIPPTEPFGKIRFGIEARWIPVEIHNEFAKQVLGLNGDEVRFVPVTESFAVKTGGRYARYNQSDKSRVEWATQERSAAELLDAAVNTKRIRITYTGRDGKTYEDVDASTLANQKVDQMKEEFQKWAKSTDTRVPYRYFDAEKGAYVRENLPVWDVMEREFNRQKNSFVSPEYDGKNLKLPGVSDWFWRKAHIMDGVQRGLQQGSCVFAYGVGSGKTSLMTILDRELKRVGLARKTIIAVKKPTVDQFRQTVEALYPGSKVLIPDENDFKKENRRRLFSRIASGKYDHIIVTHEQFKSIPASEQGVKDFFNEQIDGLRQALQELGAADAEDAESTRGMDSQVRNIVKQLKSMKKRLDDHLDAIKRHQDAGLSWDDLNIDGIHIDESHNFKNLPVPTQLDNIKGIPTSFSQRAVDLMVKARSVQKKTNGRNVFFYTGTPVSNTLAELWGQIHLVNPKILEDMGIKTFDSFASAFAEITSNFEFGWDNKFKEVTRMAKFKNGSALTSLTRMGLAVKMGNEELGLDVPKMQGGGPQVKIVPPNPEFQRWLDMVEDIATEWDGLEKKERFENSWVPIATMRAGAAAAIDPRLIFPDANDHPQSKVNQAIDEIMQHYTEGKERRTTMMVFSDLYRTLNTDKLRAFIGADHHVAKAEAAKIAVDDAAAAKDLPDANEDIDAAASKDERDAAANAVGTFNLYNDIRAKLIKRGVPENEIAIITEHETDAKRKLLFDKVRAGAVRILIGSTEKIGEGVDVPQRMSYLARLDPPMQMTAAKLEQCIGRIIRQGNLHSPKNWNKPVFVRLWAQERSMDAPIYNMMATKGKMTLQALKGQFLGDEFEDPASEMTAAMAQLVAAATGDTRALEVAKLTETVRKLTMEESAYYRNVSDTKREIDTAEREKAWAERSKVDYDELSAAAKKASADKDTLVMRGEKNTYTGTEDIKTALGKVDDRVFKILKEKYDHAVETKSALRDNTDLGDFVVKFGDNVFALVKARTTTSRNEKGKAQITPAYYIDWTVADKQPPYSEYGWQSGKSTLSSQLSDLTRLPAALAAIGERAAEQSTKSQTNADRAAKALADWQKKFEGLKFEKADELKDNRKKLDELQSALMGKATRSQAAQQRAALKKGLLFEQDSQPLSLEAQRQEVLRQLRELDEAPDENVETLRRQIAENKLELARVGEDGNGSYYLKNDIERDTKRLENAQKAADEEKSAKRKTLTDRLRELEQQLLEWLDKAIEATKFDPAKMMEGVTGAPAWITRAAANTALRTIRAAVKAGRSLAEAITEAVNTMRGVKGFNDAEARSYLESAVVRQIKSTGQIKPMWRNTPPAGSLPAEKAANVHKGIRSTETRLKLIRLDNEIKAAIPEAQRTGDWKPVQDLNSQWDAVMNAPDPMGTRVNVDVPRSREETAALISDTVDTLNAIQDAITELNARSEALPADLVKLRQDLQARLMMLKGWSNDLNDLKSAGVRESQPTPDSLEARRRFMEFESATDSTHKTWQEWLATVKNGLRYLTSPIPELPLRGERAEKSALFRRGYRLFAVENNAVRMEAAKKVENVLEPLTKLGRKAADNSALATYYRLGESLQRAAMDPAKRAEIQQRMEKLEQHLNKDPFNLFRRLVLYRDLWWRGTYLKNEQGNPITLPQGLTVDEVAGQLRKLTGLIENHPDGLAITEALRRHYALTDELQKSILAHGEIIPESLRNPLYFPHHVIDSWTGRVDRVRPTTEEDFRRYLIAPMGSGKLIQTDYLKAMYLHTADVLAHNARVDLVQKYWQPYDISAELKAQHGDNWNKPWNLPPGYKLFTPFKKLPLRMDYILSREVMAEKLGVLFNDGDLRVRQSEANKVLKVKPEDLHAALVAGEKIQWALPAEIADALNGIAKREAAAANPGLGHAIGLPFRAVNNFWKKTKLFAPWNWIRYEYGNLSTDAVDKILAADPGAGKYLSRAAKELWNADKGEQSPEFKAAAREGVFDTITAGEAGELTELPQFQQFLTPGENNWFQVRKFLERPMRGSKFREGTFRFAKFLADVERLRAGQEPVYAGAFHGDVKALGEPAGEQRPVLEGDALIYAKAAEISLKTFGDYNSLGVAGQWLRQYAVPFWSWQDVNFRYHANQLRNLADGLRKEGAAGDTARKAALRYAGVRVVATLIAVGIAKELWNQFGGVAMGLWNEDDDLESKLSEADRRRGHIILGKDEKGQVLVAYTPSAWSDVAEWMGGQNMKRLFMEYTRGQITLDQVIADYAKQLPKDVINKGVQSAGPIIKAPYEMASGKATFPDVLDQRTIPQSDRFWRLFGNLTDDRAVNTFRNVFDQDYYSQPASEQLQQIILQIRRRDPEQWAYYEAREDAADWKEAKTGKRSEFGNYTAPEALALRNFRKAIYRGDVANAERFYMRLIDFGYTAERLDASIRNQDPLSDLNEDEREVYLATLTPKQKQELELANKYYQRIAALDGRESNLFPSEGMAAYPDPALLRQIVEESARPR